MPLEGRRKCAIGININTMLRQFRALVEIGRVALRGQGAGEGRHGCSGRHSACRSSRLMVVRGREEQ